MGIKALADDHLERGNLSKRYDHNLSRARIAGYVLLAGLFLEVVAGLIWFRGVESIASVIAITLVASGVAGEIFFENRARRTDKAIFAASCIKIVQESEPGREALHLLAPSNNSKRLLQFTNRERRKIPGRRWRDRAAA